MLACSGYTGEDGFEIALPADEAQTFWHNLIAAGIAPIGLGARDTLRLEAGLNLYGAEMDDNTTPLETGLAWVIHWEPSDREFIGRKALEQQRTNGCAFERAGLVFDARTIPRAGHKLHTNQGEGIVTSGSFSPSLGAGIALARLPVASGSDVWLEWRGKTVRPKRVQPPFVRKPAEPRHRPDRDAA
jgi:aminomethyltransferase